MEKKKLEEMDYLMAMIIAKYFKELGTRFLKTETVEFQDGGKETVEVEDDFNVAMEIVEDDFNVAMEIVEDERYLDILYAGLGEALDEVLSRKYGEI